MNKLKCDITITVALRLIANIGWLHGVCGLWFKLSDLINPSMLCYVVIWRSEYEIWLQLDLLVNLHMLFYSYLYLYGIHRYCWLLQAHIYFYSPKWYRGGSKSCRWWWRESGALPPVESRTEFGGAKPSKAEQFCIPDSEFCLRTNIRTFWKCKESVGLLYIGTQVGMHTLILPPVRLW